MRNACTARHINIPGEHVGGAAVSKEFGWPGLATVLRGPELVVVHRVGVVERRGLVHTTGNELENGHSKIRGLFCLERTKEPSKILQLDGYHLVSARCRTEGSSKRVQDSPVGSSQGSQMRTPMRPSPA